MKSSIAMIAGLLLMASASYAGVTINGTTITFNDATMQSTAKPSDHGGTSNTVNGTDSFIGGGYSNLVTDNEGTIAGGSYNKAGDDGSTSDAPGATVGGGYHNTASGRNSTVAGGYFNTASARNSTIAGGDTNLATDRYTTIGGGYLNQAGDNDGDVFDAERATVGGGGNNTASASASTVSGGYFNMASQNQATVAGGGNNIASGYSSTVSGGYMNAAGGDFATVAGGYDNIASGYNSFAAGESANASHDNSFVWGGASGARTSFAGDTFNVWSTEIYLNGAVAHGSDRNMKEAFSFVSAREVLDKVVEMPVTTWRFKSEDDTVRHIGPMAQDFMAAFGYGRSDKHIVGTDADGVALAAIQGLNEKLEEQAEVNTALRWHNAQLHSRNDALEARLARLEKAVLRESERAPTGTD